MAYGKDGEPWFVYLLKDPRDGQVRRVGVTQDVGRRVKTLFATKSCAYYRHGGWFREMHLAGVSPVSMVVSTHSTKRAAMRAENIVSAALKAAGVPLVNAEGEPRVRKMEREAVQHGSYPARYTN